MATKVMMFIFLLICFLLIAQPSLQLSPFRFSVKAPFQAVGWIFIFLGITCISYNQRKEAQAEEHEKINKIIKEAIDEKREEELSSASRLNQKANLEERGCYHNIKQDEKEYNHNA